MYVPRGTAVTDERRWASCPEVHDICCRELSCVCFSLCLLAADIDICQVGK